MIIGSWDFQPIGMRQTAIWDHTPGHRQPYVPIREATHEEWLAEASANAVAQGRDFDMNHERCNHYYEISLD